MSDTESMSIEDAIANVSNRVPVSGTDVVALVDGLHRVLAEDIIASSPVPAHSTSAMDGYALRHADAAADYRLRVEGRVPAGHPLATPLARGTAARIFTGGAIPAGADTVAIQEACELDGDYVLLPNGLVEGANARPAGEDVRAGDLVLAKGTRLGAQHIGIAAAVGRANLAVRRRVRVGLLVTGDELRPPGQALPPGCIYDSNRHMLHTLLRGIGAQVHDLGIIVDERSAVRDALTAAAEANDMVIATGGMSEGDEDHVRNAVEEIGTLDFWRLPLRPGRPVAVGDIQGTPFLGLPGNPVSAMVTFWLLGRPLLRSLMGATPDIPPRFPVVALFDHRPPPGRREFLRGRLKVGPDGRLGVEAYRSASSGMLSSLTWSDGLIEIPEGTGQIAPGDIVSYIPFTSLE